LISTPLCCTAKGMEGPSQIDHMEVMNFLHHAIKPIFGSRQ